jgi:hypothetical protein
MNALSIVFSSIALVVSVASFYFTFLRHKRALYLVFVPGSIPARFPEFALLNGSKSDVVVTSIEYSFDAPGASFFFAQTLEWIDRSSLLIQSGKGIHARVTVTEPFTSSFVESGVFDRQANCFVHALYLNVNWIRNDGKPCSARIHALDVGFNSEGQIRTCGNICATPHDLYKVKNIASKIGRLGLKRRAATEAPSNDGS